MFQKFPSFKNPFLHSKPIKTSKKASKDIFLFQKMAVGKKQHRRRVIGWNQEQHIKYLACLSAFREELKTRVGRQLWQIYKQMAFFVKDKNANQCRIYHKKMMSQHDSVDSLLANQSDIIYSHSQAFQRYLKELSASINYTVVQDKSKDQKLASLTSLKSCSRLTEQYGQYLEGEKKEDNFPTDVGYPEQMGCNSNSILNRQGYMGYYPVIKHMSESYFSAILSLPQETTREREQDWQECHQLFLAWTGKLRTLMEE